MRKVSWYALHSNSVDAEWPIVVCFHHSTAVTAAVGCRSHVHGAAAQEEVAYFKIVAVPGIENTMSGLCSLSPLAEDGGDDLRSLPLTWRCQPFFLLLI